MRFYCRNTQYGTPGWVPKSGGRNDSPYDATGWFVDRGWRKNCRTLPDDILKRGRSNFGAWGSWGETRSMPACGCRNWRLVDCVPCIVYPTIHRMIPALTAITQNRCRRSWMITDSWGTGSRRMTSAEGFIGAMFLDALHPRRAHNRNRMLSVSLSSPPSPRPTTHLPSAMSSPLPSAKVIHVETRGAVILDEASPEVRVSSVF